MVFMKRLRAVSDMYFLLSHLIFMKVKVSVMLQICSSQ